MIQLRTFILAFGWLLIGTSCFQYDHSCAVRGAEYLSPHVTMIQESGKSTTTRITVGTAARVVWFTRIAMAARDGWYLDLPHARYFISIGAVTSFAMAIYYDENRPRPSMCRPPALDKWQHCYVGCEIASWCPVGALSASALGVLKEVKDHFAGGDVSWEDIQATWKGIWDSPLLTPCETYCCDEF